MNNTLEQTQIRRIPSTAYKPGQSGNPNGRPINPERKQLIAALRAVKRNHNNVDFLHHIADTAYENTTMAMKVLDKLVPNAENPKEDNANTGIKQLIIVRNGDKTETVSRQVCVQPEEISRDVEQLGHGEDDVFNSPFNVIQRAHTEQSGGNIS